MKNYLITAAVISLFSYAYGQDTITKNQELIQYRNIVENGYEGNIILEVVDENDVPISDYRSLLMADNEIIFDVPQPGPRSTFFKDGTGMTLQIEKKGYQTYISKPITTDDQMEMACVIKIILKKKE